MGILSGLRLRKKSRAGPGEQGDPGNSTDAVGSKEHTAATAIQSRVRGRKARKSMMDSMMGSMNNLASSVVSSATAMTSAVTSNAAAMLSKFPSMSSLPMMPATQAEIDMLTPADRWFTPAMGWPPKGTVHKYEMDGSLADDVDPTWQPPASLAYTMQECTGACMLYDESEAIGQFHLEILEAARLPSMDVSSADPYAMVLFETGAARTNTFTGTRNPKWGASDARAFRFNVTRPYSCCYVALKDYDWSATGIDQDDDIGRVVIELSALESNVVYDCWFEMLRKTYKHSRGNRGYLRLRYWVTFRSERERLMRYVLPKGIGPFDPVPPFLIPMKKAKYVHQARFALHGHKPSTEYNWNVLKSQITELQATLQGVSRAVGAVEALLFWRGWTAVLSFTCFVGIQFLISMPQYIPACGPLVALAWLNHTRRNRPITQPQLKGSSLAGRFRRKKPLKREPLDPAAAAAAFAAPAASAKDAAAASAAAASKVMEVTRSTIHGASSKAEDGSDDEDDADDELVPGAIGTYTYEIAKIQQQVDHWLEDRMEEATHVHEYTRTSLFTVKGLNPLAPLLGPIQLGLTSVLRAVRSIRRIVMWEDSFLTTHVYTGLVGLTLILLVIPWASTLYYGARLVGVALFGPHMKYVGWQVDKTRAKTMALEEQYLNADAKEKKV